MRLDKYLKVSRLIKRRTVANDACDTEHVSVNGAKAKAGHEISVGDVIEITFGAKTLKVRVLSVDEHAARGEASSMYEVIAGA